MEQFRNCWKVGYVAERLKSPEIAINAFKIVFAA